MTSDIPAIAFVLFFVLTGGVLFLPLEWSIPAYLLIAQIDLSGPSFASTTTLGLENTLKVIILPVVLLWRIGWLTARHSRWPLIAKTWIVLVGYATVSAIWSSYPFSAMKMIGYFACYGILLIVFTSGWSRGWITDRAIAVVGWCVIGLAVVQTYVLGDIFGNSEGRFTAFSDTQGFAAFLLSLLALLLCGSSSKWWIHATEIILVIGIILTGSRC